MSSFNLEYKDISRYQKETNNKNLYITSESQLELFSKTILVQNTDLVTVIFDKPFTGVPTVIAGFSSQILGENTGVNVYVESASKISTVIRTSAIIQSGNISIHAIYCSP